MENQDNTNKGVMSNPTLSRKTSQNSNRTNQKSEEHSCARWNTFLSLKFVDLCEEEILMGNRPNSHFNTNGWKNLVRKFNDATGKNYAYKQLRNHWDSMKKDWLLFKKLMHMETGVGWNPTNNSLDASDEWWERKLRENKEYVKFRNKDLSLVWFRYDKLFSDVAATGERARTPSQQTMHCVDENEEVMNENEDFIDFEGHVGIDDSEHNEDRGIENDVSFGIKETSNMGNDIVFPSLSSLKRKFNGEDGKGKKKISGAASLKKDIHSLLKYLDNKSTANSTPSTERDIESAMVILKNVPGIELKTELWCYACNLLSKKEMRAIFLNQPDNDCRFAWLKYNHDMSKKN